MAISCVIMSAPMSAQRKQIGEARTILKSGKNLEQAEKLMTDLLKDSANQQNVRIYDIWLQSVEKQYLAINEKMYIKQKVEAAQGFIEAIHVRHRTLRLTMQAIITLQRPFFIDGDEASLRPMILKDVADNTIVAGVPAKEINRNK